MKEKDLCPLESCTYCVSYFRGRCRTLSSTRHIKDSCSFFMTHAQQKKDEELLQKRIAEGYVSQETVNYYNGGGY